LLAVAQLLNTQARHGAAQPVRLMTTGDLQGLQAAAQRWLDLPPEVCVAVPALLS
jgi:glutamate racemase